MYAVGKLGSYISRGVYTVSAPFHPFGGAVDIIVVEQQDGSFKTSPWYIRFGKFQGVLKTREKVVSINVNGVDADFHMYLDHKGEAYFLKEVDIEEGEAVVAHQSFSGEDTDRRPNDRSPIKSKSCNYDDQIDVNNNGQVVVRSGSRRGRILGLVFGRKSIKENNLSEENSGSSVLRANSLERAEFAADLLDVKWSTNLASKRSGKGKTSRFGGADLVDETVDNGFEGSNDHSPMSPASPTLDDTVKTSDTMKVSFAPNAALETSTSADNNLESLSANENDLDAYNNFSGHGPDEIEMKTFQSFGCCETSEYSRLDKNSERDPVPVHAEIVPEKSEPEVNSAPVSSTSSADIQSGASNLVENEVSVFGFNNSAPQVNEENDEGDIQPDQGLNVSPSHSEEPLFVFSDLDGLKVNEVTGTELCSPDCLDKLDLTILGTEAMKDMSSKNYETLSTLDECVHDVQRQTSSPIDIIGFREVVCDRVERKAVSLPYMWSHVSDLGPRDLRYSCSALDLDTKSSKWALLRENASACIILNAEEEHQLAEGQLPVGDTQISGEPLNVPSSPASGNLSKADVVPSGNWEMCPFSFRRSTPLNAVEPRLNRTMSTYVVENVTEGTSDIVDIIGDKIEPKTKENKKKVRVITPTSEQLASLNLKDGSNIITFTFSTAMLGKQQVDARIYLWKWNTRVVISDVDGTITKSDVLGQFMPWVGVDWSQTGVTHLFSAIKENGYQLLFLSARAISQAYLTRQFLLNLMQDGKALPDGPVVISPDGLFPSLFREVIRRAPHEFKIACLKDIKALFPSDISPFYAGFGNRDTDEISYLKVGIPKGKIFIINPKGEVAVNRRVDTKSYPSLHSLVHDMFPPMSSTEQSANVNNEKAPHFLHGLADMIVRRHKG